VGEPLRVGIVGVGSISGTYLRTLARVPQVRVTRLADLKAERAQAGLAGAPDAAAVSVHELMASADVDLVLNLTTPAAHAKVGHMALAAGKHLYGEKPIALNLDQARAVLARATGLRAGNAPDTALGTGTQTARRAIEDGLIGVPVAANAAFVTAGHESWHPDPDFYYQPGGGPLFDMGPYYLTSLIHLLGPVRRVTGMSSRSRAERVIKSGPRAGTKVPVDVETHVAGLLEHASGAVTALMTSFDVVASRQPHIEVHGSEGSLLVPDPNAFGGTVMVRRQDSQDWSELPASAGYQDGGRGIGVADLAAAMTAGRPHRASAELALHVLDVMESLLAAAREQASVPVSTSCPVPDLVPLGRIGA
jgi:predicted dehydrogenase